MVIYCNKYWVFILKCLILFVCVVVIFLWVDNLCYVFFCVILICLVNVLMFFCSCWNGNLDVVGRGKMKFLNLFLSEGIMFLLWEFVFFIMLDWLFWFMFVFGGYLDFNFIGFFWVWFWFLYLMGVYCVVKILWCK